MLLQNFKHSVNSLKRNKLFSILNISGLAIGFSVVTIIVLFLVTEYSKDKNIPGHKNIYRLYDVKERSIAMDFKLNDKLKEQFPEIEKACAVRTFFGFDMPFATEKNYINEHKAFLTTNSFFDLFDIQVVKSLAKEPLPDYGSAVITESLAARLFPGEEALGGKMNIFGYTDVIVSAIVRDFSDKSLNCNIILHGENPKFKNWGQQGDVNIASQFIALKSSADVSSFVVKMNKLLIELNPKANPVAIQKLDDIYLNSSGMKYNCNDAGNKKMLIVFFTISIMILLLSVMNNFNYTLSLQYGNLKEIGVRKTSGAGTVHLLKLFLTDSALKGFLSFSASILLTFLLLPLTTDLFQRKLDFTSVIRPEFLLPGFLITCFVIILNSVASIYVLTKFDINTFLTGGKSKNLRHPVRSTITVFQLAISVTLLISMIIISKQIAFVKHSDIGFKKEQLVRINLPIMPLEEKARAFKSKINQLSFVESSSLSNGVPGMINYTGSSNIGKNDVEFNDFTISELLVDADFIKTMGIKLKEGREFRTGEGEKVCIINETAYKKYGWHDIEGKKFNGWGNLDVVGVSYDFNISSLHTLPVPVCLIFGDKMNDYAQISIRLQKGDVPNMLGEIQKEWQSMFSPMPFVFTFYDEFFNGLYSKEEKTGSILSLFSILAFLITCLGILGVTFQNCINRTKEVGIRKVNGAKTADLLELLNRDYVIQAVIAVVVATPSAYFIMDKWLQSFAYRTSQSWWIYATAIIITLVVVIGAVSLQTWQTARMNPVRALRYE